MNIQVGEFDGNFAPEHIKKLFELIALGQLSQAKFAHVIGCSTCTLQNWLNGKHPKCQTHFISTLRLLLSGSLDDDFQQAGRLATQNKQLRIMAENSDTQSKATEMHDMRIPASPSHGAVEYTSPLQPEKYAVPAGSE